MCAATDDDIYNSVLQLNHWEISTLKVLIFSCSTKQNKTYYNLPLNFWISSPQINFD